MPFLFQKLSPYVLAMMGWGATCGVLCGSAWAGPPAFDVGESPQQQKVRAALSETATIEFVSTPLSDVIAYLIDAHNVNIVIEKPALADVGATAQTPITKSLQGISLRSALKIVLKDHELGYCIRDEVLVITSLAESKKQTYTRIYDVSELLKPKGAEEVCLKALEQIVLEHGDTLPVRRVSSYAHLLVISDTMEGHHGLTNLLNSLHQAITGQGGKSAPAPKKRAAPPAKPQPKKKPDRESDDPFAAISN